MPDTPPTILVVDDDTGVRDVVRRILLNEGYRVIEAQDGLDALRVVETESSPLDLLLTDLKMPRMDGRQLANALRQGQPDLKVLFLTAYADSLFADRAMLEDNTAYVEKPVSTKALHEAVRLLLFGSFSEEHPPLGDLSVAVSEREYLRIPLAGGGVARVMYTGADPTGADIEEVIEALQRHLKTLR